MFIETQDTPNPATLKFLPGREVSPESPHDFRTAEAAHFSALALALFGEEGVAGVFLGADFIAITKSDGHEWPHIKPALLGAIMDHFQSGAPVLNAGDVGAAAGADEEKYEGEAAEIVAQIKELIDTRVRPAVARDGGDIVFSRFEEATGLVYLHMRGACAGCPSSTLTLKSGIENLLKHYVPEVTAVEQVL